MNLKRPDKIVLLGMMSKMPVAGVVWQTVHYIEGFRRLGFDVYYVEAHARTPTMLMESKDDDSSLKAAGFIASVMRRFDLGDRWAFHALHDDHRCYGLSDVELRRVYSSAALVMNLHGGTMVGPEHRHTENLVYLETDPVELQIQLHDNIPEAIEFLEPHTRLFTFAENYGNEDCALPYSTRFQFRPTRQPVVIDFWNPPARRSAGPFTTIGNWRQMWRQVSLGDESYSWSKHFEFLKYIDLPILSGESFELALASHSVEEAQLLDSKGWSIREAIEISRDTTSYRDYIRTSRGEFTVAKDQNVRLRTGWFSDRSATYLASGRPVITQDTGFSNVLPTGEGLFAFSSMEDVLVALDVIKSDHERQCRAAAEIARAYFDSDVVLSRLLEDVGLSAPSAQARANGGEAGPRSEPFPANLELMPVSRRPTRLSESTTRVGLGLTGDVARSSYDIVWLSELDGELPLEAARSGHRVVVVDPDHSAPIGDELARLNTVRVTHDIETAAIVVDSAELIPLAVRAREQFGWRVVFLRPAEGTLPAGVDVVTARKGESRTWAEIDRSIRRHFERVTIILVTFNNLVYTKLSLQSVLVNTDYPNYEIVVVDNASTDGTKEYLREIALRHANVRVLTNASNVGFAPANNRGLRVADGSILVLLNNDVVVPHGWLTRLLHHLEDPAVGMVGPVTNRISNEAQIDVSYRSYREFTNFARERRATHEGQAFDIRMLAMFCVAMRREVQEQVGPLDERFEIGTLEDEDYSIRVRDAGYRVICAEDDFVHHFGQATFGELVPSGEYLRLHSANRRRFEEKWRTKWSPYRHRPPESYRGLPRRIRRVVGDTLPLDATVLVLSKGDDELIELGGPRGWHFPRAENGAYAGYYPADSRDAIDQLETLRGEGASFLLIPHSAFWWLDFYEGFRTHIEQRYRPVIADPKTCLLFALEESP